MSHPIKGKTVPPKCLYKHHTETFGKVLGNCKKGGQIYCGPFYHGCQCCNPELFEPCRICGAQRLFCSC